MANTFSKKKIRASSIDSYKDALLKVMEETQPKTVFEWGPGISTEIMAHFPSVELIDSIEHARKWLAVAVERKLPKVQYYFENMVDEYPRMTGRVDKYDLIFVDGRRRPQCLENARLCKMHDKSVVILHDAEREEYQDEISKFKDIQWFDDGHTVVLR